MFQLNVNEMKNNYQYIRQKAVHKYDSNICQMIEDKD